MIYRRVAAAVDLARDVVPEYATGRPMRSGEVSTLLRACGMEVLRAAISVPADTWPPLDGVIHLFVRPDVGPNLLRYIKLHEVGHRLAGDLEEPTMFVFDGPLPEAEEVADLFALMGVLDLTEIEQGPAFVEQRIRALVPLPGSSWEAHRIPRLAGRLPELALFLASRAAG